jgi:undecaprenyl-diphosphatase
VDWTLYLKAAILGIVEGLTEFLPISSTGHLIVVGSLLDFTGEKAKTFEIAIQSGAMCAVMWEYRQRLLGTVTGLASEARARRFARNVLIAFAPAVVLGLLLGGLIKAHLFYPVPVAAALVLGGIVILIVEHRHKRLYGARDLLGARHARVESVDDMSALDALKIGLAQCVAMVPGVSRSGATIIGGMIFGLSRKAATEFSFYLAIPTLIGAGAFSLYRQRELLSLADVPLFAVGTAFAFVSALLCIRWLIRYIASHDFVIFAWYRIAFGILILLTAYTGVVEWHH